MKFPSIALLVLAILQGCAPEPEGQKALAVQVDRDIATLADAEKASFLKVAPVTKDEGGWLRLPGRLVWNEEKTVRILPQLAGRVQTIHADVGATVKAGQVLATLTSAEHGQALSDAQKAKADAHVALQALERYRSLREAGVVAEKDWQQAESGALGARAEAERTARRLSALGGTVEGNYALRCPLPGIIVERNVNPGLEFRPEQTTSPLFVVTDPGSLWMQIDASEADLGRLKPGESVRIESRQYPGIPFSGVIQHIADFVDPTTRTIKVRAQVANPDRRLKGEMFVTALIALEPGNALRIPAGALFLFGDKRHVFVAEGAGRYRLQAVQAGAEREGLIDILSGLQAGEQVVTEGNLHLLKYFKPLGSSGKTAHP